MSEFRWVSEWINNGDVSTHTTLLGIFLSVFLTIDGIYQKLHTDCNTDSALWKNVITDIGTLSTDFVNESSNILNTLRQLILRYSGKGKTISHYISGKSQCKFKIFVVY